MRQQHVQFARTRDGVTVAYAATGEGTPLLFGTGWVSHIEGEIDTPPVAQFVDRLAAGGRRRLVRFDWRGTGLSDRDVTDVSVAARVLDLEAIVDGLGAEQVDLFAWALSGPPVLVYAATHPERVRRLVFYGTGAAHLMENPALGRALVALVRADWALGARTVVQVVSPGVEPAIIDYQVGFLQTAASCEIAARFLEEGFLEVDVREILPQVTAPALVIHRRNDPVAPFAAGRELAALLPGAQFVPLAGNVATPFFGDSDAIVKATAAFLGEPEGGADAPTPDVPAGLLTILFTDLVGSTALTQRLGDGAAQEVLRTHNAIIRERLREHAGSELKSMGDGFMASFPSATRALECALAIQRAFAEYNASRSGNGELGVRIGLNAGEPVAEDADLFGTAVQAAARIAARAEAGQILVSDVVRQLAAGKAFHFLDRGRHHLKGFRSRFRLFELAEAGTGRAR